MAVANAKDSASTSVLERVGDVLGQYESTGEGFTNLLKRVKTALETSVMGRVPAEQIRPYPNQPRKYFNPATITSMAQSIDSTAQIQAGMIRRIKDAPLGSAVLYELVDGERRWRGVMEIPAERRPLYKAEIIDADEEVVQFLIAGMANFNREGHQPLETADTIKRYHLEFKIPMNAVATLLGITPGWAYNVLGLLDLAIPVQELLDPELPKDKRLQLSAAVQISKIKDPKRQLELARRVISRDVSLAQLRGEVIRVAEEGGIEIPLREIPPAKAWRHRNEKIDAIERQVSNLAQMLTRPDVTLLMRAQPREAQLLLADIRAIRTKLGECESSLVTVAG